MTRSMRKTKDAMQVTIVFLARRSHIRLETPLVKVTSAHPVTTALRAPLHPLHVSQDISRLDKVLSNAKSVLQVITVQAQLLTLLSAIRATAPLAQLNRLSAQMARMLTRPSKNSRTLAAAQHVQMLSGARRESFRVFVVLVFGAIMAQPPRMIQKTNVNLVITVLVAHHCQ